MGRTRILAAVVVCLGVGFLLLPVAARAGEAPPAYGRRGIYLGTGFSYAVENFNVDDVEKQRGVALRLDDSLGFDIKVGARVHPNVAIELDFKYLNQFDTDGRLPGETSKSDIGHISLFSFLSNVKFYPFTGRVQPYAYGGVGGLRGRFHWHGAARDALGENSYSTVWATTLGAGVDFYATPHVVVNLDAGYLFAGELDLEMGNRVGGDHIPISLNALYRF